MAASEAGATGGYETGVHAESLKPPMHTYRLMALQHVHVHLVLQQWKVELMRGVENMDDSVAAAKERAQPRRVSKARHIYAILIFARLGW
jgi:hypothetical protein